RGGPPTGRIGHLVRTTRRPGAFSSCPEGVVLSNVVVAVDGTSGSGKSSTCRGVAARLGLRYLDTGAQFRAMTWYLLEQGVDVHDPTAVAARCHEPTITSGTDPLAPTITVDGVDGGGPIRPA